MTTFATLLAKIKSKAPCRVELHAPIFSPLPATLYVYRHGEETPRIFAEFEGTEIIASSAQAERLIGAARGGKRRCVKTRRRAGSVCERKGYV